MKINGTAVSVPDNWKGYNQSNRSIFFGMIEVPFDIQLLRNGDNNVDVTFSDGGGHVSSMILQVEKYTVSTLPEWNLQRWTFGMAAIKQGVEPCLSRLTMQVIMQPVYPVMQD